jgi:hypothetical protein
MLAARLLAGTLRIRTAVSAAFSPLVQQAATALASLPVLPSSRADEYRICPALVGAVEQPSLLDSLLDAIPTREGAQARLHGLLGGLGGALAGEGEGLAEVLERLGGSIWLAVPKRKVRQVMRTLKWL